MADYIYLLENRLTRAQQHALGVLRNVARAHDYTVFLTGGAVRDLTGGGSVRDLDVTVQGEVSFLRKELEAAGAVVTGEHGPSHSMYLLFPGGVRAEIASAVTVSYPRPGRPQYQMSSISDDLRRRDFTANAMALSLNEGSYGLLMDPLNGTADIENRELRLVSNYGFIEDPSRLIRAARLISRLGWQMEERTRARYETAKQENYIESIQPWTQGYETEEIFYEEDPLRVMRALESEGWLGTLSQTIAPAKVNAAALDELRDRQGQLQTQGILATIAAPAFALLTAKLAPKEVTILKASFARPGFVREIEALETETRNFANRLAGKEAAAPSQVWKMLHEAEPTIVLNTFYSSKSAVVQQRLKTFLTESPTARQRVPYQLLQEMRITPDLPGYTELLDKLFFELMDGRLGTVEEMKEYLAPYSPPAPPPPVNLRRARARKEARPSRAKAKKAAAANGADETLTVAAQEEQIAVADGLLREGELASAGGQGTEPVRHAPLAGKVAPAATKAPAKAPAQPAPAKTAAPAKAAPAKAAAAKQTAPAKAAKAPAKAAPPSKSAARKPEPKKPEPKKVEFRKPAGKAPAKSANAKAAAGKTSGGRVAAKVTAKSASKKAAPSAATKGKSRPATKASAKKVAAKAVAKTAKPAAKKAAKAPAKPATKAKPAAKKSAPAKKAPAKAAARKRR